MADYHLTRYLTEDTRPTLNSIRQTDVDTLMIRTQNRVRVRDQTGLQYILQN